MAKVESPGRIDAIVGPMYSGKTEELIRRVRRAKIAGLDVQVFKPAIDDRYSVQEVSSHAGGRIEAVLVTRAVEVLRTSAGAADVVAIDEAQFFDEALVRVCDTLAGNGVHVIVAGLDTDFRGEPFIQVAKVMAIADHVTKLDAVCEVCGAPATRSQRIINGVPANFNDPVVLVGAKESYQARCRRCHVVPGKGALSI
ncbi:MAG: thymidine kinase [Firmicutes bacterium]|nr:thymidine kinase [Bacillota bacterium]MDH7494352.1 thymidine kinase [Bacillota bacterium]